LFEVQLYVDFEVGENQEFLTAYWFCQYEAEDKLRVERAVISKLYSSTVNTMTRYYTRLNYARESQHKYINYQIYTLHFHAVFMSQNKSRNW
jgi:hypothetical protein